MTDRIVELSAGQAARAAARRSSSQPRGLHSSPMDLHHSCHLHTSQPAAQWMSRM